MEIKIGSRTIVINESKRPVDRAVKALHIMRTVNAYQIKRVASIYGLTVEEIKANL